MIGMTKEYTLINEKTRTKCIETHLWLITKTNGCVVDDGNANDNRCSRSFREDRSIL